MDHGVLPEDSGFSFDVLGQATDQASVLLWRQGRLPLPTAYLTEPLLGVRLREALKIAEDARFTLLSSAKDVLKDLGIGKGTPHLSALEARFWAELEPEFLPFFHALPQDRHMNEDGSPSYGDLKLPDWTETVRHTALQCFQDFSLGLGATARVTIRTAQGENRLRSRLPLRTKTDAVRVV
jgi:hypothetical protein